MPKLSNWQLATIASTIFALLMNAAATLLPLNGLTTKELSDAIPSFFVPASYVFAIWGVIYVGMIAFSIYQAREKYRHSEWLRPIRKLFVVSNILNGLWIALWHYQQVGLSVLVMIILFSSLFAIYYLLEIGIYQPSRGTLWAVHIPFSLYLGWISVALAANITATFSQVGTTSILGIGGAWWAALLVITVSIISSFLLLYRDDVVYTLVIIWSLIGLGIEYYEVNIMVTFILLAIIVLGSGLLAQLIRQLPDLR